MKKHWSQKLQFCLKNDKKLPAFFCLIDSILNGLGSDQQHHPVVHTGRVSRAGGGSVAVAVGASDMQQVTHDQ